MESVRLKVARVAVVTQDVNVRTVYLLTVLERFVSLGANDNHGNNIRIREPFVNTSYLLVCSVREILCAYFVRR